MTQLDDVLRLVRIDSVSRNESALADFVESELRRAPHLEVVRIGDNVIARTSGVLPQRVLVAGHLDTVPGDPAAATIDNGVLRGLGACDMKGSLAIMLELALEEPQWFAETTWVFYAREEIARSESGLLEIAAQRPELLQADVALLGEPTNGAVEAGCQGTLRVEIVLRGARAHTARPFMGRNAIHRLAGLLDTVARYVPREVRCDGVGYVEQLQAVGVSGGVSGNVVPDEARLTLNHRFAPDRTGEEALSWLRSFVADWLEPEDEFEVVDLAPSAPPALDHPELARLVALSETPAVGKVGWTDVATLYGFGVPATNFGAGDPLLAHRSDEQLTAAELATTEHVLRRWLAPTVSN